MKPWITRTIESKILTVKDQFPVLALLGPRQSGKTTLARHLFPRYRYVNLEAFEEREWALSDGRGFLKRFEKEEGVILDEIQKTPTLFSYLQLEVDERPQVGRFILTGSQNILLNQQISQTLAGRVALLTLLPFSIEELRRGECLPHTFQELIFRGCYPRIYQSNADPVVFAESYIRTYVERDVRDMQRIISLAEFQKFMRLCAARTGQLLNLSNLATECGLTLPTVKAWLSVLEASYIIFLLQPYHINFNKRIVKTPKLYFYDTALVCNLLRLTHSEDVFEHYLRGELFETLIISSLLKNRYNQAFPPNAYFWRDKNGLEIDCLLEEGTHLVPIEIKSTFTPSMNLFGNLNKWSLLSHSPIENNVLVYGGETSEQRPQGSVCSWRDV